MIPLCVIYAVNYNYFTITRQAYDYMLTQHIYLRSFINTGCMAALLCPSNSSTNRFTYLKTFNPTI